MRPLSAFHAISPSPSRVPAQLSMAERLLTKPGAETVRVTNGDMTTAGGPGTFGSCTAAGGFGCLGDPG